MNEAPSFHQFDEPIAEQSEIAEPVPLPDVLLELEAMPAAGQIITFYSYKGGTGRTMALANVACLLARRPEVRRGVLMIDWDLEAPGLHRFFKDYLKNQFPDADDLDQAVDEAPGLIDLFQAIDRSTLQPENTSPSSQMEGERAASWEAFNAQSIDRLLDAVGLEKHILETDIPGVSLLKAGKFDESYPGNINSFDWNKLHQRIPWLFRAFAERMAELYDYVLIDSRTGLTDTSSICTVLLPNKLVVVFTPNHQSILGILDVLKRVFSRRKEEWSDIRRFAVFPLASRVETNDHLRQVWRKIYQARFENLFENNAEMFKDPCSTQYELDPYFDTALIQHSPVHSFGEVIAVLDDNQDSLSLAASYRRIEEQICNLDYPWSPPNPSTVTPDSFSQVVPPPPTEDNRFFLWRQDFTSALTAWAAAGQDNSPSRADELLLSGQPLKDAETWFTTRSSDLNRREREFIIASLFNEQRKENTRLQSTYKTTSKRNRRLITALQGIGIVACLALGYFAFKASAAEDKIKLLTVEKENAESTANAKYVNAISNANTARDIAWAAQKTSQETSKKIQADNDALKTKNSSLQTQINKLNAKLLKQGNDLQAKSSENMSLADELQYAKKQIDPLKKMVDSLTMDSVKYKAQITILQKQLDRKPNDVQQRPPRSAAKFKKGA